MKRTFFIATLAFLTLGLLTGCNSMKKLQKEAIETAVIGQVTPTQLQAVNGKINFEYTVKFAPKQFEKRMILKITPRMQYGNSVEKLPPIYLQGEKVKHTNYAVVNYKTATTVTQKMTMNFREGMQNGVLWADIEAIHGKKSFMLTPVILNQNGVQVWQNYSVRIGGVNYIPVMTETIVQDVPAAQVGVVSGYVLFPLGQSKISASQQTSAVMNEATRAMKKVLGNPNATITNMLLYVSSSPEGAERLNKNLTNNRFKAAKTFFEKDLGISGMPVVKNAKFVVPQMVSENWDGLYLLLNDSNIPNKEDLINELKNTSSVSRRGALLDSYIKQYPELTNVILPLLRRADFFVFYTVPEVVQEEMELTYFIPQAAERTPAAGAQWNWQLLNDLAVIAIDNQDYEAAQKLLEAAIVLKQDPAIENNLGIVYAKQGDMTKAREMLNKAQIKKEAQYNLGLILLQQGDYQQAVSYLKNNPNINLAYAQLMAGDNVAALNTFKKLKLTDGTEYYLMAVAAARAKDVNTMTMALQKALQLNPRLKQQIATDAEFQPYVHNAIYQQLIK